jgi:membrane protein implicated in regulation of membrane protease activity
MAIFGFELPILLVLIGLGLMIAEAMSPGAHLIVLGVSLLLAGLLGATVGALESPIALAGLTLLFGALALFVYREYDIYGGTAEQTSDSDSLRGATGRVVDRVTKTGGRVKLENSGFNPYYEARAVDHEIEEGETVVVVDPGGGNVVTVTALDRLEDDEIGRELSREAEGEDPVGDAESPSGA